MSYYRRTLAQRHAERRKREKLEAAQRIRRTWTAEELEAEAVELRREIERRLEAGEFTVLPAPVSPFYSFPRQPPVMPQF